MTITRREALSAAGLAAALAVPAGATSSAPAVRRGKDGQRLADLGDGTFLNPVMAGDRPDPAVLKDGDDYYLTFSSFDSYPGVVIWHSRDLVNWRPVGPALTRNIGAVWAVSLEKHDGPLFHLYTGQGRPQLHLGHPCRQDRGAVERPRRSRPPSSYRSLPRGRRGWQPLAVPVRRRPHPPCRRRPVDRRRGRACLRPLALSR